MRNTVTGGSVVSINELPFPKNHDRGKGHVMMASQLEMEVGDNIEHRYEGEPDLDLMAQQVQKLFKFRKFYVQMDFGVEQRLAITKVIIKLADHRGAQASHVKETASRIIALSIMRKVGKLYLAQ